MKTVQTKLVLGFALLGAALVATPAAAQSGADRNTDQYLCKDIVREGGPARDIAIAFIHGIMLGKSGKNSFNLETLAKQTDAFIDRCVDNPNEKAMDAMTKVKS